MKGMVLIFALVFVISNATFVNAGPLEDVMNWCKNETNPPAQAIFMTKKMPDGRLRGTRSAAVLTAEARKAKAAGDCGTAVQWMIHCVDHDAGAQNVLRADPAKTCSLL
jgi:hypothetical protein